MNFQNMTEEDRTLSYKRTWTPKEDATILKLVQDHGASNWGMIANGLLARTGKQCRERYHNHLQPDVKKGDWTVAEDNLIVELQAKYGNQWAKITKELPGRTDNAVKNRWHAAMRSQQKKNETPPAKTKTVVPKLALGAAAISAQSSSSGAVCGSGPAATLDDIVRKYSPRFVQDMHLSDEVDLNLLSHGHHMHSHSPLTARSDCDTAWVPTPREELEAASATATPSHALSVFLNASSKSEAVTVNGVTANDISELSKLMETARNSARAFIGSAPVLTRAPSAVGEEFFNGWATLDQSARGYDCGSTSEATSFLTGCINHGVNDNDDFDRFCWASPRLSPRVSHISPRARMQPVGSANASSTTKSKTNSSKRGRSDPLAPFRAAKKSRGVCAAVVDMDMSMHVVQGDTDMDSAVQWDGDLLCFDKVDAFGAFDDLCF